MHIDVLARLNRVIEELDKADLAEIEKIQNEAERLQTWTQVDNRSGAVAFKAAELKVRAKRRAGKLLAKMKLHGGDRKSSSHRETLTTLDQLGIDKNASSRYQRIAAVPDNVFEDFIADAKKRNKRISTAALLRLARRLDDPAPVVADALATLLEQGPQFSCVYASPPWLPACGAPVRDKSLVKQLCNLPINEICTTDAQLHLWVPTNYLFDAKAVISAWGFEFRSLCVWVKPTYGSSSSVYWDERHETLLLGIKGDAEFLNSALPSWFEAEVPADGTKPTVARELIEAVSESPRVELFATGATDGWSCLTQRELFDSKNSQATNSIDAVVNDVDAGELASGVDVGELARDVLNL